MKKRTIQVNCKKVGMGLRPCRVDLSNSRDTNCIEYWKWFDTLLTNICLDVFMISFQLGSPSFQHAAFSHPALHFSRLFACIHYNTISFVPLISHITKCTLLPLKMYISCLLSMWRFLFPCKYWISSQYCIIWNSRCLQCLGTLFLTCKRIGDQLKFQGIIYLIYFKLRWHITRF